MAPVTYDLEPLVTIQVFDSAWAAQLARARLAAAGIEAVIADEHFARMITLNTAGGARLQVREPDAAAAAEVLLHEAALPELYLLTEEDAATPRCPGCRSDRLAFERWSRIGFVSSAILLGFPIPIPKNRWLCRSCGAAWNEEDLPPRRPSAPAPEPRETAEAFQAMGQVSGQTSGQTSESRADAGDGDGDDDQPQALDREPDLVAVGRFTAPWEAHLARTRLESEGIAACVLEERMPVANLVSGQLVALSRVVVHAADAARAREILAAGAPAAVLTAADLDD